jgi:repressor LexA
MTQQQSRLLAFITSFIADKGYSPSYDDMRLALGLKSKSGIYALIDRLKERGHIKHTYGIARSVEIVRSAA